MFYFKHLLILIIILNSTVAFLDSKSFYPTYCNSNHQKRFIYCGNFNFSLYSNETILLNYANNYGSYISDYLKIIFNNCSLPTIPTNYFKAFRKVVEMEISNCELKYFEQNQLTSTKLNKIDFSENQIEKLTPAVFSSLKNLALLNLSNNLISVIHPGTFDGLRALQALKLDKNRIQSLKENVFDNLINLRVLHLNENNIESKELPNDCLKNLIKLTELDLAHNKIVNLTQDFLKNLVNLQILNLSENLIEELHEDFFKTNGNLTGINLMNNKINALPDSIFTMLTKLRDLNLSENLIKTLSTKHFTNQINLKSLHLSHNNIGSFENLENQTFEILQNLEELDLSDNRNLKINLNEFNLTNLQNLNLSHTNIEGLDFHSFWHMESLETLDLSNNNFLSFEFHMLYSQKHLKHLYLHGNNLTYFDYDDAMILDRLSTITLTNNNWDCTFLLKMLKTFNTKKIQYLKLKYRNKKIGKNVAGIECIGSSAAQEEVMIEEEKNYLENVTETNQNILCSDNTTEYNDKIQLIEALKYQNYNLLLLVSILFGIFITITIFFFGFNVYLIKNRQLREQNSRFENDLILCPLNESN